MNNFDIELQELIDKWRDALGVSLEEIIDVLQDAADELAEQVNATMV